MISSMTGFGEVSEEIDGILYTIEIRTVNNRYIKTNIRLSDPVGFCEDEVDKLLRKRIGRGSVNYSVKMQNVSGQDLFDVDQHAVKGYLNKLEGIAKDSGMNYEVNLADLLTLPGVISPIHPDVKQAESMKKAVLELSEKALDHLQKMRNEEGASIVEDLKNNCSVIKEKLDLIRARTDEVVRNYHEKLKSRVDELLSEAQLSLDSELLAREVAIFADRSDISEELSRLDSHLSQFSGSLNQNQNVGRKLDFISQEMLREANTIASKSCDSNIGSLVIEIKCAIDRIKEQVQNVE